VYVCVSCGNSEGDYVSLGWYEHLDVATVVKHVKTLGAGRIILWGRSMGAVTALLYTAGPDNEPPAGLIADSPFSSFKQLAYDLTSKGVVRVPRFLAATVGVLAYMPAVLHLALCTKTKDPPYSHLHARPRPWETVGLTPASPAPRCSP
jgi:alpha-beta hydrolase superfamily lysophospholipase